MQIDTMHKGHKRIRGVPEMYDELKTRVNFSLTPSAIKGLNALAEQQLSRSELVERIGRGQLRIVDYASIANNKGFSRNSNGTEAATSEFVGELTMSAIQSVSFSQRYNLPSCPGAYLVVNSVNRIYSGQDINLKKRFADDHFLERFKELFKNDDSEHLDLYWIECSDVKALSNAESLLVTTFQKVVIESIIKQRMIR